MTVKYRQRPGERTLYVVDCEWLQVGESLQSVLQEAGTGTQMSISGLTLMSGFRRYQFLAQAAVTGIYPATFKVETTLGQIRRLTITYDIRDA